MSNDEAWWNGKTFSTNWTGRHFAVWKDIFSEQRTQPLRILEIERPRLGVDNVLATRCGSFRELHQLIVPKLAT